MKIALILVILVAVKWIVSDLAGCVPDPNKEEFASK